MRLSVSWDQETVDGRRDTAIIQWDAAAFDAANVLPVEAMNDLLAAFYNQDLHPFFYQVWDVDEVVGVLVSEPMELTDDEISALWRKVRDLNAEITQAGEWETKTYAM